MFRSYSVLIERKKNSFFLKSFIDRLFLSGSAALPESIFQKWHDLTGFDIVEQFGSSETGRVLSNKLDGKKLAGKQRFKLKFSKI
jgi:malonyl-CoA/methylmalonyl-CoA synthetase